MTMDNNEKGFNVNDINVHIPTIEEAEKDTTALGNLVYFYEPLDNGNNAERFRRLLKEFADSMIRLGFEHNARHIEKKP
jgi:hypothetical protein